MKDSQSISNCPWCDKSASLTTDLLDTYWVACNNCNASGPSRETGNDAIRAWNRIRQRSSKCPAPASPVPANVIQTTRTKKPSSVYVHYYCECCGATGPDVKRDLTLLCSNCRGENEKSDSIICDGCGKPIIGFEYETAQLQMILCPKCRRGQ